MKTNFIMILLFIFYARIYSQNNLQFEKNLTLDEENIEQIGQWHTNGKITSVYVSNNIAFITNNNKLEILDISNPSAPQQISETFLGSSFLCEDIVGNSEKIFLANNRTIYSFDISDPSNPDSLASLELDAIINDISISGNFLYAIASYDFYILDFSNENEITVLGKLSLPESSLGLTRFDLEENFAYIGSWAAGLFIVDFNDPHNPKIHGRFLENSNIVFADGSYAYVADHEYIYILDITDNVLPISLFRINISGIPYDIISDEKKIYISTNEGLEIYGKDELNFITSYSFNDIGERIQLENNLLFIANNEEGLNILKYNDPTSIVNDKNIYSIILEQNYPNPFNSITNINYQIPKFSKVEISVYDILGNKIEELVNENKSAGSYSTEFNSNNLSSGIYFYKLKTSYNFSITKKLLVLK